MAVYIQAQVTCDHDGCKNQDTIVLEVFGFDGGERGARVQRLPAGWKHNISTFFLVKKPFLCPEHNK